MIALDPADQPLVNILTEAQERRRGYAGWGELTAIRRARYQEQMAAVMGPVWKRLEEEETHG
jgi:hypothetical protein